MEGVTSFKLLIGPLPVRLLFSREARLIQTTATRRPRRTTRRCGAFVSGCSLSGHKGRQNLYYRHANLMITSFLMLAGMAAHGTSSVASSVETVQGRSTEEFYSTTSWASLAGGIQYTQRRSPSNSVGRLESNPRKASAVRLCRCVCQFYNYCPRS